MIPFIEFHNNPLRYYRANSYVNSTGLFVLSDSHTFVITENNEKMLRNFPDRYLVLTAFSVQFVHKRYLVGYTTLCL